ncbi:hypothetical protein ACFQL7_12960 [Halocatena marina]|uniref:Uncharacterized protein n=1 Tax=Halocatena marina TaxID=2934937 RepID=A0ABD5YMY4_9EURY
MFDGVECAGVERDSNVAVREIELDRLFIDEMVFDERFIDCVEILSNFRPTATLATSDRPAGCPVGEKYAPSIKTPATTALTMSPRSIPESSQSGMSTGTSCTRHS